MCLNYFVWLIGWLVGGLVGSTFLGTVAGCPKAIGYIHIHVYIYMYTYTIFIRTCIGMLAGHDYDRVNWPLTYHNVNVFANRKGLAVGVTEACGDGAPSWFVIAPDEEDRLWF